MLIVIAINTTNSLSYLLIKFIRIKQVLIIKQVNNVKKLFLNL